MSDFQLLPPRASWLTPGLVASLAIHFVAALPYLIYRPAEESGNDPIDRMVVFLVPPSEPVGRQNEGSGVKWSSVEGGKGAIKDEIKPVEPEKSEIVLEEGDTGDPDTASAEPGPLPEPETALTEIEVDSAVVRDPTSAAPVYPSKLLAKSIEGSTFVHYVVDTTGMVDTTTIQVVRTTHLEFADAVRTALALMKFHPAVQASRKVRQWVEQNFSFKIAPRVAPADTT